MIKFSILFAAAVGGFASAMSQVLDPIFPAALPANQTESGVNSLRNIALGELRFTNTDLYNLYDQGGSPMGLLETHKERVAGTLGLLGNSRATPGDTLNVAHHDYYLPQLSFFQPGVFGTVLYFQRESESYQMLNGDSVETSAARFGLDLAAGPASGLFRIGFSAHARLGDMTYPADTKRVLLEVPSLRFDVGSRLHPDVEIGLFAGVGGRFDSLENPAGRLERVATMTLPRYGFLADIGGTKDMPMTGNVVLELGTERSFGEYRQANASAGVEYPIVWNHYWTFQTQWISPLQLKEDIRMEPAFRFAHRSDDVQGYQGIKGNQNPFKKGDAIAALKEQRSVNALGLGSKFTYRDWVSLFTEWETAGHTFETDTTLDERYNRFSLGLESQVDRLPIAHLPEGMTLAIRMGWTWRQDAKSRPGYEDYQFDPFVSSTQVPTRAVPFSAKPDDPAGYSAFHIGFGLGLFEDRAHLEGLLGFPGQLERFGINRTEDAAGVEFGARVTYQVL